MKNKFISFGLYEFNCDYRLLNTQLENGSLECQPLVRVMIFLIHISHSYLDRTGQTDQALEV